MIHLLAKAAHEIANDPTPQKVVQLNRRRALSKAGTGVATSLAANGTLRTMSARDETRSSAIRQRQVEMKQLLREEALAALAERQRKPDQIAY